MTHPTPAGNEPLAEIRTAVDRIDGDIINLIAVRQSWVEAAGKAKARSTDVVEATYRAMIGAFIELERGVHRTASERL